MPVIGIIYKATNQYDGMSYIGKTIMSLDTRKYEHLKAANNGSGLYFHRAIRKYGAASFIWEILSEVKDEEKLLRLEVYHIKKHSTKRPYGYNLTDGGEGSSGLKWSDEQKKKASESAKLRGPRRQSIVERLNRSRNMRPISQSDTAKAKIVESNKRRKGEKRSQATKDKMSEAWKRRSPSSKETREKISTSLKGRKLSEAHKLSISKATKGKKRKPHSAETKLKLSIAASNVSLVVRKRGGEASAKARQGKKRGQYKRKSL